MSKPAAQTRIWEIDFLRGLAIILMVGYHLLYDLGDFVGLRKFLGFSTDLSSPAWLVAQNFFAGLFRCFVGYLLRLLAGTTCCRFVKFGVVGSSDHRCHLCL